MIVYAYEHCKKKSQKEYALAWERKIVREKERDIQIAKIEKWERMKKKIETIYFVLQKCQWLYVHTYTVKKFKRDMQECERTMGRERVSHKMCKKNLYYFIHKYIFKLKPYKYLLILILDGNSEKVAHVWRLPGLFWK